MNLVGKIKQSLMSAGFHSAAAIATLALVSASLWLWTASPAAAQSTACLNGTGVLVEFLGVGTSNTIIMEQIDGAYQGDVRVHAYCGLDGQNVPNATITISTTVANSFILLGGTWQPATAPASVAIFLPTGEAVITIRSTNPNLTGWKAMVGTNTVTVTGAYGQPLPDNAYPTASGSIWAQTPELASIALYGTGALGLAGIMLARLRARRRAAAPMPAQEGQP
jgi:hypothetical protein